MGGRRRLGRALEGDPLEHVALVRQDEEIDSLNREVFRRAVEIGTGEDRREWAMTMVLVARVDIAEQVAFVVIGLFREFSDAYASDRRSFRGSRPVLSSFICPIAGSTGISPAAVNRL